VVVVVVVVVVAVAQEGVDAFPLVGWAMELVQSGLAISVSEALASSCQLRSLISKCPSSVIVDSITATIFIAFSMLSHMHHACAYYEFRRYLWLNENTRATGSGLQADLRLHSVTLSFNFI
jgi:hypothetical protein